MQMNMNKQEVKFGPIIGIIVIVTIIALGGVYFWRVHLQQVLHKNTTHDAHKSFEPITTPHLQGE